MKRFLVTCLFCAAITVAATSCGNSENRDTGADSAMNNPALTDTATNNTMGGQNIDSSHFSDTTPTLRDTTVRP